MPTYDMWAEPHCLGTHALFDFTHDGTQPVVADQEQNHIAQAKLYCLLVAVTTDRSRTTLIGQNYIAS